MLRTLHLRWWHAPAQSMINMFKRVGIATPILDLAPEIVDTCAACRSWSKPLPASVASIEMAETFNDQVEADIVFTHADAVFHSIDRRT